MKSIAAMVALGLMVSSSVALAGEQTATLETASNGCAACALLFKWDLKRVPGVSDVTMAERDERLVATVKYEDTVTDVPTLLRAVRVGGFPSKVVE